MADPRRFHVQKHDKGWAVTQEGSKAPAVIKPTKEPAVQAGIGLAKRQQGELIIHKEERNLIQEERTYRKDPFPPKG